MKRLGHVAGRTVDGREGYREPGQERKTVFGEPERRTMGEKRSAETVPDEVWEERARLLRVMAHPVRLKILERLCRGPCCVREVNQFIDISQPHLSQHIAALRKAKLIACHTNGPLRCYYVIRPTLIGQLIKLLKQDHPIQEQDREKVIREAQKASQTTS